MLRRWIAFAAGLLISGAPVYAETYPVRPVRFIVVFPAGGNADLMARLIGQKLADAFGKPFIIDNRGGAGGAIGEEIAARATPDGYTILLVSLAHVVSPTLSKRLAYDPMRAFTPVSLAVSVPNVLMIHKSLNVRSVPELIALAKARPGMLPPFIIEQIRRREQEEIRRRDQEHQRPRLELPIDAYGPAPRPKKDEEANERGVIILELR